MRRLPIDGRHRGDLLANVTHRAIIFEQRDRGFDTGNRQCWPEIEPGDARMRDLRAEHQAFELPITMDVDRILCRPSHLVARFHTRRQFGVAVVAPRARLCDGTENVVVCTATTEMPAQRRTDLLARRHLHSMLAPPPVVKRGCFYDE